jgi:MerR family transcriptional regulator, light-induced transcriptional regulator
VGLFSRLAAEPVYNTRAVVQRTGVPADTFRAWERRYGLPCPARTGGNQRLYSDRDIATIAWLRDRTGSGMTISQAVELYRRKDTEADNAPAGDGGGGGAATYDDNPHLAQIAEQMVEALVGYDAHTATKALEEALAFLPIEDVCLRVLQPVLYEIGRRWERDEISVSAEHFASAFVTRKLGALFNLSQPEAGRGPVVAACLEGELHEVGLLLTSLFLSRRGVGIVYLGPNLPIDDLIDTIRRLRPPLVVLGATTPEAAEHLAAGVAEIRARCAGGGFVPAIGYGGYVFVERPELRDGIDGIFLGVNADEAARRVDRVLAERERVALN